MTGSPPGHLTPGGLLAAIPRTAAVLSVLRRHGFGALLRGRRTWPPPERVRLALEELGPVFVKFGQVLSTRGDLVPGDYRVEFERLQDRARPVPYSDVEAVFRSDLGAGPSEVFRTFAATPIASASMAQVHAAETHSGRSVVVKVQRPGLMERIEEDVGLLGQVAAAFDLTVPSVRPLDLPAVVAGFRDSILDEADFGREARNIARFQESLGRDTTVWVPPVLADFSGRHGLTLERSSGVRIDRFVAEHPDEARETARRLGDLFIRQVFRDGLFHADPHPGNFFMLPDGRLCLHDFGMIGELDERLREALVGLVRATVAGDARTATRAYMDMGLLPADVDRRGLEEEVGRLVRDIRSAPLREVSVGAALERLVRVGGSYRIRQPRTFLLLARAFVTLEGLLATLDPDLAFIDVFGGAFRGTVERRYQPGRLRDDAMGAVHELDHLVRTAPGDVRRILDSLSQGDLGRVSIEVGPASRKASEGAGKALRRTISGGALTLSGTLLLVGAAGGLMWLGAGLLAAGVGLLFVGRRVD